jgi:Tol biopolymer transport system component
MACVSYRAALGIAAAAVVLGASVAAGCSGSPAAEAPSTSPVTQAVATTAPSPSTTLATPSNPTTSQVTPSAQTSLTTQVIVRASVAGDGTQANNRSYYPSISADGRYVAFQSSADNLVPGDTNLLSISEPGSPGGTTGVTVASIGVADIFVFDRETGTTERVSVATDGTQANAESNIPWISGDGRLVAFQSDADNLVDGDTNGKTDVFAHDRSAGTTERVSLSTAGSEGNGDSYPRGISGDGRFVVFVSDADNLVDGDANGSGDVFVRDRQKGTTERASVSTAGHEGNGSSYDGAITPDGRFVAFDSEATDLVEKDTNGVGDIFVHDRQEGTTERVSVNDAGKGGNHESYGPCLSADGRYVAFASDATNLVPEDTSERRDIFVYDRQSKAIARVNVGPSGEQANGASGSVAISADGRYVAFQSYAGNLVSGDTNGVMDLFVRDTRSATTRRESVNADGVEQDKASSTHLSISAGAQYVAFMSEATNLVPNDTNGCDDIFVRQIRALR